MGIIDNVVDAWQDAVDTLNEAWMNGLTLPARIAIDTKESAENIIDGMVDGASDVWAGFAGWCEGLQSWGEGLLPWIGVGILIVAVVIGWAYAGAPLPRKKP